MRMHGMILRGLVVGLAILGGWWASRAAATSADTAMKPAALATKSTAPLVTADDPLARKLLEDVQRRTTRLDQRERELAARTAALESLEEAITESLGAVQSADGAPGTGSCRLRGGVTRIYESMRPEEAAQILDQLDDETLRVVFARMEPRQIAAIMASMSRERAVAFTRSLAADAGVSKTAQQ
jgi:flagellar motility protein MotE (MotC chaperone)